MAGWLDTTIMIAIALIGLFIFYRALKEPMDLLFSALGKLFMGIINGFRGMAGKGEDTIETIRYG